ncbi:hypothetical protein EYF80_053121 [Liparis tanakae]|uniref:Uncharacterized protein n=1 Tax=Liparis tanakae TaxID=230148 RepID=A0A4Z2F6H9_9TELE|nr:hypothetical protein EYF80_053121 [Liparis tanakae]
MHVRGGGGGWREGGNEEDLQRGIKEEPLLALSPSVRSVEGRGAGTRLTGSRGGCTLFTEAFVNCGCDVHIHHRPAACWVPGWGCIRSTDSDSRKKGGLGSRLGCWG